MKRRLLVGTRGSRLALRQTAIVVSLLRTVHPDVRLDVHEIRTEGDRSAAPLSEIGGLGVFTRAIEDALIAGTIDIAVHSLKDLPPQLAPGLVLAAIPERGDARDALVSPRAAGLDSLPEAARVGTGSERRSVQLRALRGDLVPVDIRGNVDTRIRKVEAGEYDAAVVAMAGLVRLGLGGNAAHVFSVEEMVPAVGQGALAVEARAADDEAIDLLRSIDDGATREAADAERAFLERLGAGCRLPVGAHAVISGGRVQLRAMLADTEGAIVRREMEATVGDAPAEAGRLADAMLRRGAGEARSLR